MQSEGSNAYSSVLSSGRELVPRNRWWREGGFGWAAFQTFLCLASGTVTRQDVGEVIGRSDDGRNQNGGESRHPAGTTFTRRKTNASYPAKTHGISSSMARCLLGMDDVGAEEGQTFEPSRLNAVSRDGKIGNGKGLNRSCDSVDTSICIREEAMSAFDGPFRTDSRAVVLLDNRSMRKSRLCIPSLHRRPRPLLNGG